jgi:mercuric ion transport protein
MPIKEEDLEIRMRRAPVLMAAGGMFGALAASSCCILPLVLFSLGISGAWIGNFTQLAPYQPYFIAATLLAFSGRGLRARQVAAHLSAEVHAVLANTDPPMRTTRS